VAATFSKGVVISEYIYVAFQGAFAAITVALILGAFAERIKFSAVLLLPSWFTFSYLPMAHMVWYWAGRMPTPLPKRPMLPTRRPASCSRRAPSTSPAAVVHINAAVAGLVGAFMVGKRIGFGRESFAPHSLTLTIVGASLLLWWAGSASTPAPPRSQRRCRPGLREYLGGHRCAAVAGCCRMDHQGQAVRPGCCVRCRGRPGGDHPGLPASSVWWAPS
jgi:hypothetical protein